MDSIDEYIMTFNELMDKLRYECTSDNIMEKFKDGLLKTLLEKILDRDIWPERLDKWQNAAWWESHHSAYQSEVLAGHGNWLMTAWDAWLKALYKNAKAKNQPKKKQQDDDAMQVDIAKLQKLTDTKWEKLKKEGHCFKCQKQGHLFHTCPEKGQTLGTLCTSNPTPSQTCKATIEEVKEEKPVEKEDELVQILTHICCLKTGDSEKLFTKLMEEMDVAGVADPGFWCAKASQPWLRRICIL